MEFLTSFTISIEIEKNLCWPDRYLTKYSKPEETYKVLF